LAIKRRNIPSDDTDLEKKIHFVWVDASRKDF